MSNPKFTMNGDVRVQELTVENAVLRNRLQDRDREVERLESLRDRSLQKIEALTAKVDVIEAREKEKDKAVEKLARDQAQHFLDLNNHQAVARQALNDADLKLTHYVTKDTNDAIVKEWRERISKTETAVLRMADLIVISESMENRLKGIEAWKERIGGSLIVWGVIGTIIGGVIVGVCVFALTRGLGVP